MLRMLYLLCVLLPCIMATTAFADEIDDATDAPVVEIMIPFTEHEGRQVSFIYNPVSHRVELRMEVGNCGICEDELQFLADIVSQIASSRAPYQLGDSDYTIDFGDKYPVWGPHRLLSRNGTYQCLFFGENASLSGMVFNVYGRGTMPSYSRYNIQVIQPPDRTVQ